MGHVTTRADDEAVLEMLRLRRTMPASMIATKFRSSQSAVRITTNRVVRDDSA